MVGIRHIAESFYKIEIEISLEEEGLAAITRFDRIADLGFVVIFEEVTYHTYVVVGGGPYPVGVRCRICAAAHGVADRGEAVDRLVVECIAAVHVGIQAVEAEPKI